MGWRWEMLVTATSVAWCVSAKRPASRRADWCPHGSHRASPIPLLRKHTQSPHAVARSLRVYCPRPHQLLLCALCTDRPPCMTATCGMQGTDSKLQMTLLSTPLHCRSAIMRRACRSFLPSRLGIPALSVPAHLSFPTLARYCRRAARACMSRRPLSSECRVYKTCKNPPIRNPDARCPRGGIQVQTVCFSFSLRRPLPRLGKHISRHHPQYCLIT